jgi:hypothetical protein
LRRQSAADRGATTALELSLSAADAALKVVANTALELSLSELLPVAASRRSLRSQ